MRSVLMGFLLAMVGVGTANAAVTVSGTIDSAGSATPVAGAIVTLRIAGPGGTTLRDTTGANGAYAFDSVAAGNYTLSVSATGYTTKSVADTVAATAQTVNVALTAIVVSTVSGKVDSAGSATPVAGAVVSLRSSTGTTVRDTAKADGSYSFTGVVAGVYTLTVTATGYNTKTVTDTVAAAPSTVNIPLVAIVVSTVSGKVDSAGSATPVAGAVVSLRSSTGTTVRDTAKADGSYSFTGVVAGVYTLTVTATGYTTKTVTDTVATSTSTVNIPLVATVIATVSGKVDSAGSATPVAGAVVSLRSSTGTTVRDTAKADGSYSFTGVVSGVYTLTVTATGYTTRTLTDTVVTVSNTVNVSLAAVVVATVSGKIDSAATSTAVAGAIVTLRLNGAGATTLRDTVKADGLYSFTGVAAGVYTLTVTATGYTTKTITDTVSTATNTVNVSLVKTGTNAVARKPGALLGQGIVYADGVLRLQDPTSAGLVRVVNARGEIVYSRTFAAGTTANLEIGRNLSKGSYFLGITQGTVSIQDRIVVR